MAFFYIFIDSFKLNVVVICRARGPLKWLDPGAFGTLGVGAGFALGAKLCYPDHLVVILYGDGSCGYSIVEFDTFVRHKVELFYYVAFLRKFYVDKNIIHIMMFLCIKRTDIYICLNYGKIDL